MTEQQLPIPDAADRERALAPDQSFIVQAPAGSGKTELLTQRVLRLLAVVEHPEEILAMTFTRKAAAEMRQRILGALQAARGDEPLEDHKRLTWQLGRAALARDSEQGWDLLHSPARLRVQTIDGLCATLTRQMPLLSQLGANPDTLPDARPLYLEAARHALDALEDPQDGVAVARLLRHLENDREKTANLIADLLARREQWLGQLLGHNSREVLEEALADCVQQQLDDLQRLMPTDLACSLAALAHYAHDQRAAFNKKPAPLAAWADRTAPPTQHVDDLPAWQGLAELCLTGSGGLRARLTVSEGFPGKTQGKDQPERLALFLQRQYEMKDCLAALADSPALVQRLQAARGLPSPRFAASQWAVLEALVQVLLRAAAELKLVFAAHGQVDFGEVHARALLALGTEDAPTDLALALDYRLRHILVDEFQDTSSGQYQLLEKLTAGWQPDDGRTLFVVGDPMQSIYAFRQAEVGLYLKARASGIGQIALEPLTLRVNFRSQQGVVDWVNASFPVVFPTQEDQTTGAVSYSASVPHQGAGDGPAVQVHAGAERDDRAEASSVLTLIRQAREQDPEGSIAVLARGRAHLAEIARALKQAGIAYRAVDVDRLGQQPVVQDLHSLRRALCHAADRVAWLSLLRSPLVGLTLADLLALAGDGRQTLWTRLNQTELIAQLSADGQARLARVLPVLRAALAEYRRRPLRDWLLGSWQALGGPASLSDAAQLESAHAYLDLLAEHDRGGELADPAAFEDALDKLFAPADTQADESLQLMTMHKSKGLEFDTVILPGLGRSPRREDKPLITWLERPRPDGDTQVLIAPIKPAREVSDAVFDFVWSLNKEKQALETARLLYVAATRAKKRLHLFGHVGFDAKSGEPRPAANALLATLWPAVTDAYSGLAQPAQPAEANEQPLPRLSRLPADWQAPAVAAPLAPPSVPPRGGSEAIPFDWAGETARHVGTLVHRYLERIGREGLDGWDDARIEQLQPALRAGLADLGVGEDDLGQAVSRAAAALRQTLADPRGRWLLGEQAEARCEWALSEHGPFGVSHHVIDRSFVDADGTRWIIDYKTGSHGGSDIDAFLDQERDRYADQLAGYARVVRAIDDRPIRLALYHPLLGGWRDWSPDV